MGRAAQRSGHVSDAREHVGRLYGARSEGLARRYTGEHQGGGEAGSVSAEDIGVEPVPDHERALRMATSFPAGIVSVSQ